MKLVSDSKNEMKAAIETALEKQSKEFEVLCSRMLASRENEERSGRNRNIVAGRVAPAGGGVRAAAGQQHWTTTTYRQTASTITDMLQLRPLIPPVPSAMPQSMT